MKTLPIWIVVVLCQLAFAPPTPAQPGSLDPAFGQNGIVTTNTGADWGAYALVVQADKKVVAFATTRMAEDTNRIVLVRYLENGEPDVTFGTGGIASFPLAPQDDQAEAGLLQPDGRLVVIGSNVVSTINTFDYDFLVARFLPNGDLDTSFGNGKGYVLTDHDYRDFASNGVLQPDGKIVLLGNSDTPDPNIVLARYLPDGSPDMDFGELGVKVINADFDANARGLALQTDGKLIVCGYRDNFFTGENVWATRFTSNGQIDSTFGTAGTFEYVHPGIQRAWECKIAPGGEVLLAGYENMGQGDSDFLAVRFTASGELDNSFGDNGKTIIDFNETVLESAGSIVYQPDGKVILVGNTDAQNHDIDFFALARLTPNGEPDSTFGQGGKVKTVMGLYSDYSLCAALAPDGKIVVGGRTALSDTIFSTPEDILIARFLSDVTNTAKTPANQGIALQGYPNPFSATLTIEYVLQKEDKLTAALLNAKGQIVHVFFNDKFQASGRHVQNLETNPALSPGNYWLVLSGRQEQAVFKIEKI